ncbi:MAG: CDP-glycerol glycerophosphotransferase family protein [Treponema sp.]|nr:CDP-glycerol glycerophosphotransferase family protein [Treponema sp.]MCR5621987.1 CDP-glycerol glycerophosphotransferase family protein [Treponema sp.]
MTPPILYIDPGTGSMLFSVFIGVVATIFFLLRAAFIRLQLLFSSRKAREKARGDRKKFVIYNEGRQYYNIFLPVLKAFERRQVTVDYLTGDSDDPLLKDNPFRFVRPEYIGSGNAAFARLNLLTADVLLATTPGLDVYQWKRSKNVGHYAHIRHGTGDATLYRMFGLDYFDSVLLTGDYQMEDLRTLEKERGIARKELVTVGCTYLDALAERMREMDAGREANDGREGRGPSEHTYTVLLSPSWGPNGILSRYGEQLLDPLVASGMHIIIRPHPQSRKSEPALLERLEEKYRGEANVEWNYDRDNLACLVRSDIMISDFSSIIFDYLFLCDRPVVYVNADMDTRMCDAGDLDKRLWQFTTLEKCGIELRKEDFPRIGELLRNASDSEELARNRAWAKSQAWMHQGEAGERTAEFMISKEQKGGA